MKMLWSAKNNAFIPALMIEQYKKYGWDTTDCAEIDEEIVAEFMGEAPLHQVRVTGNDGLPAWGDMPIDLN